MSLLSQFIEFFRKPDQSLDSKSGLFTIAKKCLMLWSLGLVFSVASSLALGFFLEETGLDGSQNLLQDFFENNSVYLIIAIVFLWGPLSEEVTFRLFLRYSPLAIGFSSAFLFVLLFEMLVTLVPGLESKYEALVEGNLLMFLLGLIGFTLLSATIVGLLAKFFIKKEKADYFFARYTPLFVHLSSLIFSFVHFFNYENHHELWIALPLLVAPQLMLGYIMAFIRLRFGFIWSLGFHSFHNAAITIPAILFLQIKPETLELIEKSESDFSQFAKSDIFIFAAASIYSILLFLIVVLLFFLLIADHRQYATTKTKT